MKKFKIIGLIILPLITIFSIYIAIEINNFNNKLGVKPLIIIGEENCNKCEMENTSKTYYGIGFSVRYEYYIEKVSSDNEIVHILSGQFNLFNKYPILYWIS